MLLVTSPAEDVPVGSEAEIPQRKSKRDTKADEPELLLKQKAADLGHPAKYTKSRQGGLLPPRTLHFHFNEVRPVSSDPLWILNP